MNNLLGLFHPGGRLRTRQNFWIAAVTIATGALGVWSEVNAGNAFGKKILTRSLHVSVHPDGANAEMTLRQMPSGSVWVEGSAWTGNTVLTANDWKATSGEITVGAGVATAQGTAAGTIWDFSSLEGPTSTPVSIDLDMRVEDTSTVWSLRGEYAQSGLIVSETWARSGDHVARVDVAGHEDVTLDGGAMAITVDGKSFVDGEGGLGHLKQNTTHTVEIVK